MQESGFPGGQMPPPAGSLHATPEAQGVIAWASYYAFTMGWVIQPIHRLIGHDAASGRPLCSCELTGKRWNNCNPEKPGKHPWKGWKQAPMDTPEQGFNTFKAIWDEYPLGVNIGVRTGAVSGIWALDLDMGTTKNGVGELHDWLGSKGLDWARDLQTLSAKTGGGGYHYVFKYPKDVEKIPTVAPHRDMGDAVDVKGDGGYILVAPSMHASGRIYEWQDPCEPDRLRSAPPALVETVKGRRKSPSTVAAVATAYTPSLEELKDYAAELARKRTDRAKQVGKNMLAALNGEAIAEDGGAHDAYRDIMYFVAKRWSQVDPPELLKHFEDSVNERYANKPDASTDMSNLWDSLNTALSKAAEDAKSWIGQLQLSENGAPTSTDANLFLYFVNHEEWQGVLAYDNRRNMPVYRRRPPFPVSSLDFDLSRDKTRAALWFQGRTRMVGKIAKDDVRSAVLSASLMQPFDPLYDWVMALKDKWDGTRRLETLMQRVAGVEDTAWARTVFPLWMRSLVARITQPGCKVDTMLILEGHQGFKKSSFFAALVPDSKFFSDSMSRVKHDVETVRLIHSGPAIFEASELTGLKKQEVEEIKAFLATQEDDLRPLYESPKKAKRRCVFVGTTNRDDYLRDETGGRRFWPLRVMKKIDIVTVKAELEQLYAEALHDLAAGLIWWIPDEAEAMAQREQNARYEEDIWVEPICRYLAWENRKSDVVPTNASEQMSEMNNHKKAGDIITVAEVAEHALKIEMKNARGFEGIRIQKILQNEGWLPCREYRNGKRVRGWKRPPNQQAKQDAERADNTIH